MTEIVDFELRGQADSIDELIDWLEASPVAISLGRVTVNDVELDLQTWQSTPERLAELWLASHTKPEESG